MSVCRDKLFGSIILSLRYHHDLQTKFIFNTPVSRTFKAIIIVMFFWYHVEIAFTCLT